MKLKGRPNDGDATLRGQRSYDVGDTDVYYGTCYVPSDGR